MAANGSAAVASTSGVTIFEEGQAPVSKYISPQGLAPKSVETSFDFKALQQKQKDSRKLRYISKIADQCSVCAPLSWSIYIPGRPKGPVNMPQSRQNPDPVLLQTKKIDVEIFKTVMR